MKIGEFAKKYNIPISSVRHYINLGILMPERNGTQFNFRPHDLNDMETVNNLKSAGFSLKEINTYINTLRAYDPNDDAKSPKLISMLQEKELDILAQKQRLNDNLRAITQMIEEQAREYATNLSCLSTGIHVSFLDYMECPRCGKALHLENARISQSHITSGVLSCSCGYTAHIDNGFLFTDIDNDLDEDSEFFEDYFGDDKNASYDSAFLNR